MTVLPFFIACSSPQAAQSPAEFTCPAQQVKKGDYCVENPAVAAQDDSPKAQGETNDEAETAEILENSDSEDEVIEESPEAADEAELETVTSCPESVDGSVAPECSDSEVAEPESFAPLSLASAVDISMAAQAGPIVQHLATAYLPPGARRLGVPFAAQFIEGQALVQEVQLEKGRCYTVVAVGLPPVAELNLFLYNGNETLAANLAEEGQLAADDTKGSQAVLGPRASCFSPDETGVFQLVLAVQSGQGVAAGQVFEK